MVGGGGVHAADAIIGIGAKYAWDYFTSSSRSTRSSTSVMQSGPIQSLTFPPIWNNSRWSHRTRAEGQQNDDLMPWRKYKKEKSWIITSPILASGGLAPVTFFGFDLGCSFYGASGSSALYGMVNPFNIGTTGNYSDIYALMAEMTIGNSDQIRWDIDRCNALIELVNNSNVGVDMELYYLIPRAEKNNVATGGILDDWLFDAAADGLTVPTGLVIPTQAFGTDSLVNPYMSSNFCTRYRIVTKKSCRLGPGETLKVHFSSPLNGVRNTNFFFKQTASSEFSRHVLIRFRGQMGVVNPAVGADFAAQMPVNVLATMHEWITCRWLPGTDAQENVVPQHSGATIPSADPSENIVQPGNARDETAYAEGEAP